MRIRTACDDSDRVRGPDHATRSHMKAGPCKSNITITELRMDLKLKLPIFVFVTGVKCFNLIHTLTEFSVWDIDRIPKKKKKTSGILNIP